jgi:hypothetical protein
MSCELSALCQWYCCERPISTQLHTLCSQTSDYSYLRDLLTLTPINCPHDQITAHPNHFPHLCTSDRNRKWTELRTP